MAKQPKTKATNKAKTAKRAATRTATGKGAAARRATSRAARAKRASAAAAAPARKGARRGAVATKSGGSSAPPRSKASAAVQREAAAPPRKISTGGGPSAAEIGRDLVMLVNVGRSAEAVRKWYADEILSIEGDGMWWKGMKGIEEKWAWWEANHETHALSAEGPFVGATVFSVRYSMSFTPAGGERVDAVEVGVYTVEDGEIVREEYMYAQG